MKTGNHQAGFSAIVIIVMTLVGLVLLFFLANVITRSYLGGPLGRGPMGAAPVVFKGGPRVTPEGSELSRKSCPDLEKLY